MTMYRRLHSRFEIALHVGRHECLGDRQLQGAHVADMLAGGCLPRFARNGEKPDLTEDFDNRSISLSGCLGSLTAREAIDMPIERTAWQALKMFFRMHETSQFGLPFGHRYASATRLRGGSDRRRKTHQRDDEVRGRNACCDCWQW